MLKNILNLKGAQQLSNNEQKAIHGGENPNICKGDGSFQYVNGINGLKQCCYVPEGGYYIC